MNYYKADIPPSPKMGVEDMSPFAVFPELFKRVAKSGLFEDPKAWADICFQDDVEKISALFKEKNPQTKEELKQFVEQFFFSASEDVTLTVSSSDSFISKPTQSIHNYIESLWGKLWRPKHSKSTVSSSLLQLPYPYIVPGGRFDEVYYWDSYFTMLGFVDRDPDMILNMVNNFSYVIDKYGFVPNGNRSYFLSRSQPPFFHCLVGLTNPKNKAAAYAQYLDVMITEYNFWMAQYRAPQRCLELKDGVYLNRYYDNKNTPREECYIFDIETATKTASNNLDSNNQIYRNIRAAAESGWDFSSRWLGEGGAMSSIRTLDILPVDLNAILFSLENAIALGYKTKGEMDQFYKFNVSAQNRKNAIDAYFWDASKGFYFDYDLQSSEYSPVVSAAGLYPLYFGCASDAQAARVAEFTQKHLLAEGGLNTTTQESGEQWDSPNGWAPLQWIAIEGLRKYGHHDLAHIIKTRWLKTVNNVYEETGSLYEKYNVVDGSLASGGEYRVQQGFGWTNGVIAALHRQA